MHDSLDPQLAEALGAGMPPPPVPIFDVHMHSGSITGTRRYVRAARAYGVVAACNLSSGNLPGPMTEAFGAFFQPCGWPRVHLDQDKPIDWDRFRHEWVDCLDELADRGMRSLKIKLAPWAGRRQQVWLDDDRLAPLLDRCARRGVVLQTHIAHPSCWWPKKFDPTVCGPKRDYLAQLERVLTTWPALKCLSVHMGSHPEDLTYLDEMMERFGNYHIDTSATKWVVRELSAKPDAAREFFIRRAERICFGSDLVVRDEIDFDYYTSRFHVQRTMWETGARTRSMIRDPDAPAGGPYLHGLALPVDVLTKIYRDNARRLFGAGPRRADDAVRSP